MLSIIIICYFRDGNTKSTVFVEMIKVSSSFIRELCATIFFYLLYKTPQSVRFFMSYLAQNVAISVLCASQENNFNIGITDYVVI